MWTLLAAAVTPAWAGPEVGFGLSGLYDLRAPLGAGYPDQHPKPPGNCDNDAQTPGGLRQTRLGCDNTDFYDGDREFDTGGIAQLSVAVPLRWPLTDLAALRVEPRGGYAIGTSRVFCPENRCVYDEVENLALTSKQVGAALFHVSSLTVSVGPEMRFSADSTTLRVGSALGAGLTNVNLDSDFFDEKALSLMPTGTGSASIGVVGPPAAMTWFADLTYATTLVLKRDVQVGAGSLSAQPFAVNGPRVDVGVQFGGKD